MMFCCVLTLIQSLFCSMLIFKFLSRHIGIICVVLGRRFETFCLEFWERQVDQRFNAHLFADDGGENEDPGTDEKAPRTGSQHEDTASADRSDED